MRAGYQLPLFTAGVDATEHQWYTLIKPQGIRMQMKLTEYLAAGVTYSSVARSAGLTLSAVIKMVAVGRDIRVQGLAGGKLALYEQKRIDKNER